MQSKGVEAINPKGEEFDGELHEAIAQMPAEREDEKGKIFDVIVDLRKNSKTFGKIFKTILSEKNSKSIFFVP